MNDPSLRKAVRVLAVDDDAEQLSLLARVLRKRGFDVQTVEGPIGVSSVVRAFDPDIVLVDVFMPALRGDHLLSLIRRNAGTRRARLVLFSSADRDELRKLAEDVEADGWLQKTFDGEELARSIHQLVA
jgi:DNA-binding response OmpR family regulator